MCMLGKKRWFSGTFFEEMVQLVCSLRKWGVVMPILSCICFGCVTAPVTGSAGRPEFRQEGWCFWLQDPDPVRVAELPVGVAVVDYSRDGSDDKAFSPLDVARISRSGKQVWSYLSIGEAESYRFYWDPAWQ